MFLCWVANDNAVTRWIEFSFSRIIRAERCTNPTWKSYTIQLRAEWYLSFVTQPFHREPLWHLVAFYPSHLRCNFTAFGHHTGKWTNLTQKLQTLSYLCIRTLAKSNTIWTLKSNCPLAHCTTPGTMILVLTQSVCGVWVPLGAMGVCVCCKAWFTICCKDPQHNRLLQCHFWLQRGFSQWIVIISILNDKRWHYTIFCISFTCF